jgi:hypothetical protein
MTLDALQKAASDHALHIVGTCPTKDTDGLGAGTIALLGPDEPAFWATFTASPEYADKTAHAMDRWSTRTITTIADQLAGQALFPFGQPARPFLTWALRTGVFYSAPVGLLVHRTLGLLASFRGAVFLDLTVPSGTPAPSPCVTCDAQPCRTACPIDALTSDGYDVPACHGYLDTKPGNACLTGGCAVRMACPLSQSVGRVPAQSAFHMAAFHPAKT